MKPSTYCASSILGNIPVSVRTETPNTLTGSIEVEFAGKKRTLRVLIDSSAQLNFISQKIIVEEQSTLKDSSIRAYTVDGQAINVYGEYTLRIYTTDTRRTYYSMDHDFVATDVRDTDLILGYPWLRDIQPEID